MTEPERKLWRDTITNCEKYMAPKREMWRTLFQAYNLQFPDMAIPEGRQVKISRFRQTVHRLIAGLAFNHPHIFMKVLEKPDAMPGNARASDIYQRTANEMINLTGLKQVVHQAMFNAAFCSKGFVKVFYNPQGDDSEPPYVSSDWLEDDMVCFRSVSPWNILTDPELPPDGFYEGPYVVEKMPVPIQFARKDPRFKKFANKFKPLGEEEMKFDDVDPEILYSMGDMHTQDHGGEAKAAIERSRKLKKIVLFHVVYDRWNRMRYTFANGIDEPVEEVEDPLLAKVPLFESDPLTGDQKLVGMGDTGSYLVRGGFPFKPFSYDLSDQFWGTPLMEYLLPIQRAIIESVSRRLDLLDMFKRIIAINEEERKSDASMPNQLQDLQDGKFLWMKDINNMKEVNWGSLPNDQIRIEQDLVGYERETFDITGAGASRSRTATGDALGATDAQLMKEFYQANVADVYKWAVESGFSIMGDPRYTPDNFLVNVSEEGAEEVFKALEYYHFNARMKVTVEPGSMQPLIEQLERDDTMALAGWLINLPEVDRRHVIEMAIKAYRKDLDTMKIMKTDANPDAQKAAELELKMIFAGQVPQVTQGEDHDIHLQIQSPQAIQQRPEFMQLPDVALPGQISKTLVLQAAAAHEQQHQQVQAQEVGGATGGATSPPPSQAGQGPQSLVGEVQSIGNQLGDAVQAEAQATQDVSRG